MMKKDVIGLILSLIVGSVIGIIIISLVITTLVPNKYKLNDVDELEMIESSSSTFKIRQRKEIPTIGVVTIIAIDDVEYIVLSDGFTANAIVPKVVEDENSNR